MLALGVDRVEGGFVLALLDAAARGPRVAGTWVIPCPPGDEAAVLRDATLEHCPESPDAAATSLDEREVTHRLLRLPFTEPARLAATVPFELESLVPFDLEDAITTFTVLSREREAEVLAALAPRTALAAHLEQMREADLDPAVVDLAAIALAGLVRLQCSDALVVEPRPGGIVAWIRQGHVAGLHVLDGSDLAALRQEARWLALALLGDETPPPVVEIATNGDRIDLAKALGTTSLPLARALPAWVADVDPGALRAVALAARAAGLVQVGVNFRAGEFVYHAPSEEAQRQLRQTAIVAALALVLGLASYGIVLAERRAELAALRDDIRKVVTPIVPGAPIGQERLRLEGAVESLERRRAMLGGSTGARPPVLDVFRLIDRSVPQSIPFEIDEVTIDAEAVRLHGRTDSYESVDVIKRALAGFPNVDDPDVRDVKTGIDDRIEFRAALAFKAEQKAPK